MGMAAHCGAYNGAIAGCNAEHCQRPGELPQLFRQRFTGTAHHPYHVFLCDLPPAVGGA